MNSLQPFMETVPLPMMSIGADYLVTAINSPCENLFGEDSVGRHYIAAIRQPRLINAIESVFETCAASMSQFRDHREQNDVIYDVQVSPLNKGVMLTFQDRSATDGAVQARRDFVANVSHELRTPVTALAGFIETLQGAAKDDPVAQARFLGIMATEADRMTRLIDDLLSLSRVEQYERSRPKKQVCLADVTAEVLDELGPLIRKSGLGVTFEGASNTTKVMADEMQLRQVINNLVENALKYGGDDEGVVVRITGPQQLQSLRGQGLVLQVQDHGDGIAAHHLPRLAERFYRVDSGRSRAVGGTGLGLAIVKHIVNRHRGRLSFESTVGVGTTVSVSLPIT